ncbi:unnamed protein product, partial [marine sediment metagenome]
MAGKNKESIINVKKMPKYCPYCGSPVKEESKFC